MRNELIILMGDVDEDSRGNLAKHIDLLPPKGLPDAKTGLGIYELSGDTLRICFEKSDKSGTRPASMTNAVENKLNLMVLERVK